MKLKAPFPYFGGKSRIAHIVWDALGDVKNYVEPFFGSGAVLLSRPHTPRIETVNDADGLLANFWRAVQREPNAVAEYANNPVNECDLHARHLWLVGKKDDITSKLCGDPDWYDAKAAGYWVWGASCWISGGWCRGKGPWIVRDGEMVDSRQLPHLGNAGKGVKRQLPHLGDAGHGVTRICALHEYMRTIAARLRNVRVCCGDWTRVCGPSVTTVHGLTGVFLDPPYSVEAGRDMAVYAHDSGTIAHDAREWAIAHGPDPLMRIVLCGYAGEHDMPDDWRVIPWRTQGGYGNKSSGRGRANKSRERLWLSPHCVKEECLL